MNNYEGDLLLAEVLRMAALPDPFDEREVLNSPLLREASKRIKHLVEKAQKCDALAEENEALTKRVGELEKYASGLIFQLEGAMEYLAEEFPEETEEVGEFVTEAKELLK